MTQLNLLISISFFPQNFDDFFYQNCLLDSSPCGAAGFDYPTRHGVGINDGNAQIPQHVGHCALPCGHPALRQQQR
jgi:hypothetical protein